MSFIEVMDWDDERSPSAIGYIERSLLGTILLSPPYLDMAALLSPEDFSSGLRGTVFETMRSFPRRAFDIPLVAMALERKSVPPPRGSWSWIAPLAKLYDLAIPDDELIPHYVRCIKESAALRRAGLIAFPVSQPRRSR